ncbi:MAG TPA: HNH endonuclease [Chthoniobacteraceae bacterium]|nr:HNH endonuclease [Chthoniobacteraceae bacterium]
MELRKNKPYTYKEVEQHFHGGQIYLQKREGKIVTGCLVREKNPFAPRIMVVGTKPLNIQRADEFCEQKPTIPIFIKEKVNIWFYVGMYAIENVEYDSEVLKQSEKLYGETLNRIIYLSEVGQNDVYEDSDFSVSGHEGRKKLVTHLMRERDYGLARSKKAQVLRLKGKLECEVCRFGFKEFYKDLDKDYAEVHHLIPISTDGTERITRLEDLAIVCSNCHSAIHRIDPMPSVKELKQRIESQQGSGANG